MRGLIPNSLAICLSDIFCLLFALSFLCDRLFQPLPYSHLCLDRLNAGNLVGVRVDSEADVWRTACSWPSGSWTYVVILIIVIPKVQARSGSY